MQVSSLSLSRRPLAHPPHHPQRPPGRLSLRRRLHCRSSGREQRPRTEAKKLLRQLRPVISAMASVIHVVQSNAASRLLVVLAGLIQQTSARYHGSLSPLFLPRSLLWPPSGKSPLVILEVAVLTLRGIKAAAPSQKLDASFGRCLSLRDHRVDRLTMLQVGCLRQSQLQDGAVPQQHLLAGPPLLCLSCSSSLMAPLPQQR